MADEKESSISEIIKKVASVGLGAAFMTEDAIKSTLGEVSLSKDIVANLIKNAKDLKQDFYKNLSTEITEKISKLDHKKFITEILDDYEIEVNAKFSFTKKEKAVPKKVAKTKKVNS